MNNFKEITAAEIPKNVYELLDKDWMLITVPDGKTANAMTASWGGFGILWGREVCYLVIRNTRHTFDLLKDRDKISLCFMPENMRDAMNYCGAKSGRDTDKLADLGLSYAERDGYPVIGESKMLMFCKKLCAADLTADTFCDAEIDSKFYAKKDYHRLFICAIEKVLIRED